MNGEKQVIIKFKTFEEAQCFLIWFSEQGQYIIDQQINVSNENYEVDYENNIINLD